ncbi:MAG: amidohydrolase [Pseudomonadota bacterium]|nr:amidohydrolase [Pseudomonadota bacterium]QKK06574.1 MAG: amidohydrolase [Pseudomonadota bacterium]
MREWRQDFHKNPETAYEETRTAEKVATLLKEWGIETHTGIGGTGVVGILKSADADENSPSICLRADMDALAITEANTDLPYISQNDGKAHACGHDGHTAMLLGAAKYLAETKDFTGTVYFVFQPAEEGGAGAQAMIDDGLFDLVKCDGIYGLHIWPSLPAGQVAVAEGFITANSDRFTVKITGKGGHAAYPAHNIDIVAMAADLIAELHKYKKDEIAGDEGAVLAVTKIHGGEALNAMPETLELGGTVRTFTDEDQDKLEAAIKDISEKLAKEYGATVEVAYNRGYPAVHNSPEETAAVRDVLKAQLGEENVKEFTRTMGAEDFAYYTEQLDGAFIALGQWDGESNKMQLHSPHFNFNDDVLETGAKYWTGLVEAQLPVITPAVAPPVKPKPASTP